jgi:thiamine biosynthesis lipoprotein
MGMPITVEVVDEGVSAEIFDHVFDLFATVDANFSPYKATSEVGRINSRELTLQDSSADMQTILMLAELTKQQSDGYFDVYGSGRFDPSGVVKGWAIQRAANALHNLGMDNFYVDAGGDVFVQGHNSAGNKWRVGILNPFDTTQIVKTVAVTDCGVATSGLYQRGQHVYNPHRLSHPLEEVASMTVIGRNIVDADRFATAAFAMGYEGIYFIEALSDAEGYLIDNQGIATMTSGFGQYLQAIEN